jgi:hypothetical protein
MPRRKPTKVKTILVEVSGFPESWTKRLCKIDGDKIARLHQPTWGMLGVEATWYCQRCGTKMEHPIRA